MSSTHHERQPRNGAPQTSRVWTLPNAVSLLRLLGVPLFLWLVLGPEEDLWALVVLMISGFTDWLDGYLARLLNQTSKLGEILDPVADRLYILAVVVGLAFRDIIPWWVAIILPARDAFLWCLVPFLRTRGYSALPVHFLGKAATANLLYAFPLLFVGDGTNAWETLAKVFGWAFAIWGMGLYWWAGLLYAWQVRKLLADRDRRAPELPRSQNATERAAEKSGKNGSD
jgi:cardiolipin synthase